MKTIMIEARNPKKILEYIKFTSNPKAQTGYAEKHHVLPNSFLLNDHTIELTYLDHLEAHKLLKQASIKGKFGRSATYAYRMMLRGSGKTFGIKHTKEEREKISKSLTGKILSESTKNKIREKALGRATVFTWLSPQQEEVKSSARELAEEYGLTLRSLYCCISGKYKHHKGWKFLG